MVLKLVEFDADVECPRCSKDFSIWALLKPGESRYAAICPDCKHGFNVKLDWTEQGVIAKVGEKVEAAKDERLRKAVNKGRVHPRAKTMWFLRWYAAVWFMIVGYGSLMLFPFFLFDGWVYEWLLVIIVASVLLFIIVAAYVAAYHAVYKFRLADDAVTLEKGVIFRNTISIPYQRIQTVKTHKGFLHWVFGLCAIHVQTAAPVVNIHHIFIIDGVKDADPIVKFLLDKANDPDRTHVTNQVSVEEENSKAILEELKRIRKATDKSIEEIVLKNKG